MKGDSPKGHNSGLSLNQAHQHKKHKTTFKSSSTLTYSDQQLSHHQWKIAEFLKQEAASGRAAISGLISSDRGYLEAVRGIMGSKKKASLVNRIALMAQGYIQKVDERKQIEAELKELLNELSLDHVNLQPQKIEFKERHIHVSVICETEDFEMVLFIMGKGALIPLHDHPDMTVMSKVLYGKIQATSLDWIASESGIENGTKSSELRLASVTSNVIVDESEVRALYSKNGNIHELYAHADAIMFDLLLPPYTEDGGDRDVGYYQVIEQDNVDAELNAARLSQAQEKIHEPRQLAHSMQEVHLSSPPRNAANNNHNNQNQNSLGQDHAQAPETIGSVLFSPSSSPPSASPSTLSLNSSSTSSSSSSSSIITTQNQGQRQLYSNLTNSNRAPSPQKRSLSNNAETQPTKLPYHPVDSIAQPTRAKQHFNLPVSTPAVAPLNHLEPGKHVYLVKIEEENLDFINGFVEYSGPTVDMSLLK